MGSTLIGMSEALGSPEWWPLPPGSYLGCAHRRVVQTGVGQAGAVPEARRVGSHACG